jgi:hypothetical protein
MVDEPRQVPNPVQWGYSEDGIEINDAPAPQKSVQGVEVVQQIQMPIGAFDEIVKDYIARREGFLARGLVQGVLFDDVQDSGF